MDLGTAFIVALKIIAANFILGIILFVIAFAFSGNPLLTFIASLILATFMTTIAVFFILEEAENIAGGELMREKLKQTSETRDDIMERMKREREASS